MSIFLDDLIAQLGDLRNEFGGECEVFMAQQPSWPFEYSISGVYAVTMDQNGRGYEDEEHFDGICEEDCDGYMHWKLWEEQKENHKTGIYLTEGQQTRYLPGAVSREIGWR